MYIKYNVGEVCENEQTVWPPSNSHLVQFIRSFIHSFSELFEYMHTINT